MVRLLVIFCSIVVGLTASPGCGGQSTSVPTAAEAANTPTVAAPSGEGSTLSAPPPGGGKLTITPGK